MAGMFSRLISNLLLLSLITSVRGQNNETDADAATGPTPSPTGTPWEGCVNPTNPDQKVTIGDPTYLCLILADDVNWNNQVNYLRLTFQPIADEYSRFVVPATYRDTRSILFGDSDIAVHAAAQTAVSFQKLYVNITKELVYPQLTAIIDVEMGDVVGISWDDGCIFCGSSECDENTFNFQGESSTPIDDAGSCGETVDFCRDSLARESGECDLMLYVVWTGTDSNGRAFKSAAYRFSAFPKQELGDNFDISLPQIDWPDNPFT